MMMAWLASQAQKAELTTTKMQQKRLGIGVLNEQDSQKKPSYTGVMLSDESSKALLNHPEILALLSPEHEQLAHHMTINMGPAKDPSLLGQEHQMHVTHVGYTEDGSVVAVKVSEGGDLSQNKTAHITIGVDRQAGGKPAHSNKITNWKPLERSMVVSGVIGSE